jgi:SAM-dependent methyltransferase
LGAAVPSAVHAKRHDCRVCGGTTLTRFLELGPQPLANGFLDADSLRSGHEEKFPLDLYVCHSCSHVQLLDVVSKETLFSHYLYFSTVSRTIPTHFAELAKEVATQHAQRGDMVVEVGSNDGVLLSAFEGSGLRTLGVEPARNVAEVARRRGVPTMNRFFTLETADQIARDLGHAKVVIANNVVGHIDDLEGLVRSVARLLTDDGTWIFEVPYLVDLIDKNEFDTVYHEHLSYFALRPIQTMLRRGDLSLVDVKRQSVHGGTIRVYARKTPHAGSPSAAVHELLALERAMRLDTLAPYHAFAERVHDLRTNLRRMIDELKKDGKRIAGYGAPAKGNTLLNYVGIGPDDLEYIQDTTPVKQGLYTPGTHVLVVPPAHFQRHPPDVALLLAWNYEPEIVAKEEAFRRKGGRFIVPIPMPRLV